LAAVVASIVERYEIDLIDDNVLITVATLIVCGNCDYLFEYGFTE
jgi:hypothetical protein